MFIKISKSISFSKSIRDLSLSFSNIVRIVWPYFPRYFFAIGGVMLLGDLWFLGGNSFLSLLLIDTPMANLIATAYLYLWFWVASTVFSKRFSFAVLSLIIFGFTFANQTKLAKLGISIMPSDFLLMSQYPNVINIVWGKIGIAIAIFLLILLIILIGWKRQYILRSPHVSFWRLIAGIGASIAAITLITVPDYQYKDLRTQPSIVASIFDWFEIYNRVWVFEQNYRYNGQVLTILMNANSAFIKKPSPYNKNEVQLALSYPAAIHQTDSLSQDHATDVVVIMSEAWWDPAQFNSFIYSDPLLNNLKDISRGWLFSPVFGGYTANTEFEFLTRISNATLPVGSIPFKQYVNRHLSNLATDFQTAGFTSTFLHPYTSTMWNRKKVYANLGFNNLIFYDRFTHTNRLRGYISDASLAKELIDIIKSSSQKKHFIFTVSVQNHGPYEDAMTPYRPEHLISLKDNENLLTPTSKKLLSTYATGVRDTVQSFNEIVKYFKQTNRKAIVVMFGDHLPLLGDDFKVYTEARFIHTHHPYNWTNEEQKKMHTVPVVAWTNLPTKVNLSQSLISPIYLGTIIKKAAGIAPNSFDHLLEKLKSQYPILSQFYSQSQQKTIIKGQPDFEKIYKDYATVTYDLLFGENYGAQKNE